MNKILTPDEIITLKVLAEARADIERAIRYQLRLIGAKRNLKPEEFSVDINTWLVEVNHKGGQGKADLAEVKGG